MIRFLKWLVNFLETRFPAKVTVTETEYRELKSKLDRIIAGIEESRILDRMKTAEAEINKLNVALGFGGRGGATIAPYTR